MQIESPCLASNEILKVKLTHNIPRQGETFNLQTSFVKHILTKILARIFSQLIYTFRTAIIYYDISAATFFRFFLIRNW